MTESGATLRARPTIYNGIQMRSRLEARVASALDDFGLQWAYEPIAFASGKRRQYLPDFAIDGVLDHGRRLYLEVKPTPEACEGLCDRMEVILRSFPSAGLGYTHAASFELGYMVKRRHIDGTWDYGAITRCPCGTSSVGSVVSVKPPDEDLVFLVSSLCHGCSDHAFRHLAGPSVLRLPPFEAEQ